MSIGDKIKKLRTDRFMSRRTFADKIGYDTRVVSLWERNQRTPRLKAIREICELYDITLDTFFEGVI